MVTYLRSMGGPLSTGILCKAPPFSLYHGIHQTIKLPILETQYNICFTFFLCLHFSPSLKTKLHPNQLELVILQPITKATNRRQDRGALRSGGAAQEQIWVMSQVQGGWTDSEGGGDYRITLLETDIFAPGNGWFFNISCLLLGPGLFAGVFWLVSGSVSKIRLPKQHQSPKIVRFVRESMWKTRWCFQIFIIFTMTWGNNPIWL